MARVESAKPGKIALVILPLFHAFGLAVNIHTVLVAGATCILVPKFEPEAFSKLIKKNKPHFLIGVPTMFEALASSDETSKTYLRSVTDCICGGDTLKPELRSKVNNYLRDHGSNSQVRVGYGLSESTGACVLTPSYYYKEGAIGMPFPDMEVKIVKPGTTKEVKPNRNGEICVSGPTIMMGYLNEPEETANTLIEHRDGKVWLHTGDLGYKNREGIVFFESRLKRMIITSGYNVYPQYIEAIITAHPAVSTCMVVGIPHPYKKQVPVANIVLNENYEPSDQLTKDIEKYLSKSVAKYSMPVAYEYHKSLPKTLIGKVNFKKLEEDNAKKYGKKK
jgi:long-chain acyl-CoA synthetase